MSTSSITRQRIPRNQRASHTGRLFGLNFPMRLEPTIFNFAGNLAAEYDGGYWEFYKLSNGGFYMAPAPEELFSVSAENGYEGSMSGAGYMACLNARYLPMVRWPRWRAECPRGSFACCLRCVFMS